MEKGISLCIFGEPAREEDFRLLRDYGFGALELPSRFVLLERERREQILRWIRDSRLGVFSAHAPFGVAHDLSSPDESARQGAIRKCLETLEALHKMGGEVLVVHAGPSVPEDDSREERLRIAIESLKVLNDRCAEAGVRLAVETLPRNGLGNCIAEHLRILEHLDSGSAGICLDINHITLTSSLREWLAAMMDKIFSLHICDNDGSVERHWCPYRGVIDWDEFSREIANSPYRGPAIYEVVPSGKGLESDLKEISEAHQKMWRTG